MFYSAPENTNSAIAQRVMLDIELRCKDGSFQASSVYLATNSVVFHRMFFSEMPMAESLTNIVHLDDILMADMELMIKFCQVNKHYEDLAKDLSKESTLSSIHVAHRFEFTLALEILSLRYAEVVPVPTPQDLQFADRLELNYILNRWSLNCESSAYFYSFVVQLADFPLSSNTLKLFADVHQSYIKSDTNPPLKSKRLNKL